MTLTDAHLKKIPIFGIAGNFAEHLSQAGEDADFINITTQEANAPKGIFPIFIPDASSFLGIYPMSSATIQADFSKAQNVQMEAEACLLLDVSYDETDDGRQISVLKPKAFTAFNDCSIRRPNARKISEKKNWGMNSTGICRQWIEILSLSAGQKMDNYHIASMIRRQGTVLKYGVDSPVVGYQYFHETLLDWMLNTFNRQTDFGPLENLHQTLANTHWPSQVIVTLGATRYTAFGETGYLLPGDELGIYVYDAQQVDEATVIEHFKHSAESEFSQGCYLHQTVQDII